jgi:hypothetical protein
LCAASVFVGPPLAKRPPLRRGRIDRSVRSPLGSRDVLGRHPARSAGTPGANMLNRRSQRDRALWYNVVTFNWMCVCCVPPNPLKGWRHFFAGA